MSLASYHCSNLRYIWASSRARTNDLLITNQLFYQLNYGGNFIANILKLIEIDNSICNIFFLAVYIRLEPTTPPPCVTSKYYNQLSQYTILCVRRDSNPYVFRHIGLNDACLPVSTLTHIALTLGLPDYESVILTNWAKQAFCTL